MYSKLITPPSRALYHGGLSGGPGGAVSCRCHSPTPPTRILSDGPAATSSRPARKYTASRQSRRAAWEEVLIVVSLHFTPQITNEHQPRQCLRKINKSREPLQLNTLAYFNRDASCKRSRTALSKGTPSGPSAPRPGGCRPPKLRSGPRVPSTVRCFRVRRVEENLFDFLCPREPRGRWLKQRILKLDYPGVRSGSALRSGVTAAKSLPRASVSPSVH